VADDDLPQAVVEPPRRRIQLVWIIPIVAAVAGGWIAVTTLLAQGPEATISFRNAEGLEAGKTKIRYKDVEIGLVTHVALAPDGSGVIAEAQFTKEATNLLVDDTRFWVVKPRVSSSSVSGLGTLFSGSYLGVDVGKSQQARRHFVGLEVAPIVTGDVPGTQFKLHSEDIGSLGVGSPVYYRRIEVGRVVSFDLDPDGNAVTLQVFVDAPYDQYVTNNTRFWHASGVDVSLDATGVKVDTASLAAIIAGGIAFQAPADLPPEPSAAPNTEFVLASDRAVAMRHAETEVLTFELYFRESLRGLTAGAPVDFHGITIGEVKSVDLEFENDTHLFKFPVTINLYPERLRSKLRNGQQLAATAEAQRERIDALVGAGLRAQLRTGNLLTGQLYVALDFFPDAKKVTLDWNDRPPRLPTQQGTFGELQAMVGDLTKKIDAMPIDRIATELERTLADARSLIKRLDVEVAPAAKDMIGDATKTLQAAQSTLSNDSPLQTDLRQTLQELNRTTASMRDLLDYLQQHPEALIRGKPEDKKQ
jgi:paraquat-inducible protein B